MDESNQTEMAAAERDDFLGVGGTGVLSVVRPDADRPHAVPVSYGYDAEEPAFYFRLATGANSRKGELAGRGASFVVHGETGNGWRSVVAEGTLERTTDESVATRTLDGLRRVEIPYVDVFDRPTREVSFEFFYLDPEELTARMEA